MLKHLRYLLLAGALSSAFVFAQAFSPALAQNPQQTAATTTTAQDPVLLSAEELETLVAPIALYPDDLVAAVMAASLYPLQIVQAERFLEKSKTDTSLKPDANWDGSVVSLLNYPDLIAKMNDDLAWTEQLGTAVTNQEKDVLVAIQQLRGKAVATGAVKSDNRVTVETVNNNVVIQPAKPEVTYVPQYDPQILLDPTYVVSEPIIYGDPYPSYYYPYAPYWTGFVTGAIWGAAMDWDNWHSWGGDVDIDIDINDIDRRDFHFDKNNINNLDWNRDRSKFNNVNINNIDRTSIANNIRNNDRNRLDRKTGTDIRKASNAVNRPGAGGAGTRDVRRDVQQGLAKHDGSPGIANRPGDRPSGMDHRPGSGDAARPGDRKLGPGGAGQQRPAVADRKPAGRAHKGPAKQAHAQVPTHKPAARPDPRPRQPSAMGHYSHGHQAKMASHRGQVSHRGGSGRAAHSGGARRIRRH